MPIKQTLQKRKYEESIFEIEEGKPRKILKCKNVSTKKIQDKNDEILSCKNKYENSPHGSDNINGLLDYFNQLCLYSEEITSLSTKEEEEYEEINLERKKNQISQIKKEEEDFICFEKINNSNDYEQIVYFQDNDEENLFQIHVVAEVQELNLEKNEERFEYKDEDEDFDNKTYFSKIIQQKTFKAISKQEKKKRKF